LNAAHGGPDGEFTEALSDNYQKLFLKGRHSPNRWLTAQIERVVEEGALLGSLDGPGAPTPDPFRYS